ncbi:MAG: MAPEG family protein [Pseudomonadota bacterium]
MPEPFPLPVTAFYAALSALILLFLTVRVIQMRQTARISLGDGENKVMRRRVRAHGNAAETIPTALILLALSEGLGAPLLALHLLGAMLVAGRIAHAFAFLSAGAAPLFRVLGMGLTLTMMALAAIGLLAHALF